MLVGRRQGRLNPPMGIPSQPKLRAAATLRDVLFHRYSDQFSEALIYFMVVFSPWAFGTTQRWSIWTMNFSGYLLGLCLLVKYFVRLTTDYKPDRWDHVREDVPKAGPRTHFSNVATVALAALTVAILAYCLTSALNARAMYDRQTMNFTYRPYVEWLPHSYDRGASFRWSANYVALACFFWAVRDWLLGLTAGEARAARQGDFSAGQKSSYLPRRLRRLLLVIAINGALLGVEGIAQRESGSHKMLWILEPRLNQETESQFGPYNYRGNAAQYFNLAWPIALGLWWALRREVRHRNQRLTPWERNRSHLALLCVLIMAACPVVSTSRAGAAITVLTLGLSACILLVALRRRHPAVRFALVLFFVGALAFGFYLGEDALTYTVGATGKGYALRESMYETAGKIPQDFPWFGTGPGSFEAVFSLYRNSTDEYWPAQLHNDWLETRITFGWIGSALIALAFICALGRWFFRGPLQIGWQFVSLLWVALAGCLLHARFDFPMQIHSTLLLFLLICAILFTVSRKRGA